MRDYFQPLIIFVVGNLGLLFLFLFFPAIETVQTTLEAETAGAASSFWGWSWVVTSIRFIVVLIFEGVILFAVAKSILGLKRQ